MVSVGIFTLGGEFGARYLSYDTSGKTSKVRTYSYLNIQSTW